MTDSLFHRRASGLLLLVVAILCASNATFAQRPLGQRAVKLRIDQEVKHATQSVTGRECLDHISWLADDLRGGRLAGTIGAVDSARYIERFFKNQALLPGAADGGWRHRGQWQGFPCACAV